MRGLIYLCNLRIYSNCECRIFQALLLNQTGFMLWELHFLCVSMTKANHLLHKSTVENPFRQKLVRNDKL